VTYDPAERRDTPLALELKARIRKHGPISVAEYMRACLGDAEHGYYRGMPAIGAGGDFVTAPEISQVFGELVGLWSVVAWQQMGAPGRFHFVELGPGRGTMMADALRAAALLPAFRAAAQVHLVESNPHLRASQAERLGELCRPCWHDRLADIPPGPVIILANEFLDTLGADHIEVTADGVGLRGVGLDTAGRLDFVRLEGGGVPGDAMPDVRLAQLVPGQVLERQDLAPLRALGEWASTGPLAVLFIDYGHSRTTAGATLQAVRAHRYEHPLASPGEADLSVGVDFAHVGATLAGWGLHVDGPVTQAEFLGRLGIIERASRLMAANPAAAAGIEAGVARLMAPNGMGSRFKVLGARSATLPALPGLSD